MNSLQPCVHPTGLSALGTVHHPYRRRAAVAPFVAVLMTVLLAFAALTVDIGYVCETATEMQMAVDASALAGASALLDGATSPVTRAIGFATQNIVAGSLLDAGEVTVTLGNWNGVSRSFVPLDGTETRSPNAVRVLGERTGLPLHFASIVGVGDTAVGRSAVALVGSGGCSGIWALSGISGAGDLMTDSYDSRDGAYGGANIHPNGDICSNTDINLSGSVEIYGDVMYGTGYSLTTSGNAYDVWGVVASQCCPPVTPDFGGDMATAATTNDNSTIGIDECNNGPYGDPADPWNVTVDGGCRELILGNPDGVTPSTYYFDSISIAGNGPAINVVGPTTIYIDGGIADFGGGGIVNVSEDPTDLVIYTTGPEVRFRGDSDFYGAVVAPNADIILEGTTNFYGALLGQTVDIRGNSGIHIDEALIESVFGSESVATSLVQ